MKRIDISKITHKFYDEDDIPMKHILEKDKKEELWNQIGNMISELYTMGYKMYIFHMDTHNKTLHVALLHCCGDKKDYAVDIKFRKNNVDPNIIKKTKYNKIVWEDLLQIGESY